MELTNNFDLDEFLQSRTADANNYEEQYTPPDEVIENIRQLCINVLQPLRDELGEGIHISSGYRCKRLNDKKKGAVNSDHMKGMAADIQFELPNSLSNQILFDKVIELGLPFRQLIDEKNYEWVHVSYNVNDNKKQILHLL